MTRSMVIPAWVKKAWARVQKAVAVSWRSSAVQQGGLAGAGRAHDGQRLVGRHDDADAGQGVGHAVGLEQAGAGQDGGGGVHRADSPEETVIIGCMPSTIGAHGTGRARPDGRL
ncbi:hypothetical protein [Streptomyces sp. NPDC007991]|uniref:hypothetical protein n=1 Tax=Streptomyces sp. NPDC007991 TaxID=3364803 RepID=UPI0036EFC5D5